MPLRVLVQSNKYKMGTLVMSDESEEDMQCSLLREANGAKRCLKWPIHTSILSKDEDVKLLKLC